MNIRPIRTEQDHRAALAEIEACWGAPDGSEEGDRLDVLVALVESYEAKRWPTESNESFDPIDVLRYAIDELGHSQRELAELLGSRSRASEISGASSRPHGRHDSQDQRGLENSRLICWFGLKRLKLRHDRETAGHQVVRCQASSSLEQPHDLAFASVLKCRLKPTTAAEVSAFTSSLSAFTANTVNR